MIETIALISLDGYDPQPLREALQNYGVEVAPPEKAHQCKIIVCQGTNERELLTTLDRASSDVEIWICSPHRCSRSAAKRVNRALISQGSSTQALAQRIISEIAMGWTREPRRIAFGDLIGISKEIKQLKERIAKFAALEEPILITGPTGAGKGVIAREIHRCSGRSGDMFKVNAAAFGGERLESELFGHVKGSFTGATSDREGLIEASRKGSFFLDEIGELPLEQQSKILAVIEDRKVRPIGSNEFRAIQSRMIFATNKNLREEIKQGYFREDLYQRLAIYTIDVPPLKDRREDILLLANIFLRKFCKKYNRKLSLPQRCREALFHYDWPGNVRELESLIFRTAGLSDGNEFATQELLDGLGQPTPEPDSLGIDPKNQSWEEAQAKLKKVYFRGLLAAFPSKKEAIAQAGISKARFYEVLKELGM